MSGSGLGGCKIVTIDYTISGGSYRTLSRTSYGLSSTDTIKYIGMQAYDNAGVNSHVD